MRNWATIAVGILLAALLIFVVISNSDEVTVVLPLIQWRTKLWAAMVGGAVVGAAASLVLVAWPLLRLKLHARRHQKRIAELEQEVHGLRTLPITTDTPRPTSAQKV
jgi:uncharacterized integral membrane protein